MFAGLDLGSTNTKLVIIREDGSLLFKIIPTKFEPVKAGEAILRETGEDIQRLVVTGYGRVAFNRGKVVTEITCQAKGCHELFPEVEFILDLGGQDAKIIKKDGQGRVVNFLMNDKCAAGTGRFLEVILAAIGDEFQDEVLVNEVKAVPINSMCTVFAESEVISLLARGTPKREVVAGLFKTVAKRLAKFVASLGQPRKLIFTGGGANYKALRFFLQRELGIEVVVPPEPSVTAALGAALIAKEA
ncbi:acyl-CoA dehydratase activase [Carboxydothermus pertinax]|uniref:CoA activase n=1 Tax=Carboxydothermus pertinax TaxID=870242 RepID=A0A1L8CWP0_9THEO|nr:acyl-CoA dehydratase activase [Carboxydothermus pertinax]GAV23355.1 CoA activase [Carboxydothermus pertinax]